MRKYIAELIGTFFLVLTIGMVVLGGKGDFAPLAIGAVLMVMIYAGGYISGAHYNPAVTLGVLIRGRITIAEAVAYMIVQVAGAAVAAYVVMYFVPVNDSTSALENSTKALLAELIGTFALVYVVLNVATSKETAGNNYFGLAIAFTVMSMAYVFGPISGAAFNPAVAIGATLMNMATWSDIWVYLAGCFGGGIVAALLFRVLNAEDK